MWGRIRSTPGFMGNLTLTLLFVTSLVLVSSPAWAAAPVVDSFSATPPNVLPGAVVAIDLEAHDPDCSGQCTTGCGQTIRSDLTSWSANGGTLVGMDNGTTASPYVAAATWQAPNVEGTYEIRVDLSDSGNFLCGGRASSFATMTIFVSSVPNDSPVVEEVIARPTVVFPGRSSTLSCTATDGDGDSLTYSWDTNFGTVTPTTDGQASFTGPEPGVANVTCIATDDKGASGSKSVVVSVTDAIAEREIRAGFATPQRIASDSMGNLYVVDRGTGGLTVLHAQSGEQVYRLDIPGLHSIAVDWNDDLLIGGTFGIAVVDRRGNPVRTLVASDPLDDVSDVAVDLEGSRHRYGALFRKAGKVVVFDDVGVELASFGATGDGPGELRSPSGLAVDRDGNWLVADRGHGQIKVFSGSGWNHLFSFGGSGSLPGEFIQLDDVAVTSDGIILASDSFRSIVQTFRPDGSMREIVGEHGEGLGRFVTPTGLHTDPDLERFYVASLNAGSVQVFRRDGAPDSGGPAPEPRMTPEHLDFGWVPVGQTGSSRLVTIANSGSSPLGIRSVGIAPEFRETHDCSSFLDPGESCTVFVTFAPAIPGNRVGELFIDTSAGSLTSSLVGVGQLLPTVDLALSRADSVDPVASGWETGSLLHVVTLTNRGPSIATGVAVRESLVFPEGVHIQRVLPEIGSWSAGVWSVGTLPVGGSARLRVEITVGPSTAPADAAIVGSAIVVASDQLLVATSDDSVVETTSIVDGTAPWVESVDALGGQGVLTECESVERVGIRSLVMRFSESLIDLSGHSTPGDVTRPQAYFLVGAGADGDFQTTACHAPLGDDRAVAVEFVSWSSTTATATLELEGVEPLAASLYRLMVCDELRDLADLPLDGDGDGAPGGTYDVAFRSDPGNLFDNGDFDCALGSWVEVENLEEEIVHSSADLTASPLSGSAWLTDLSSSDALALGQCLDVSAGTKYELRAWARNDVIGFSMAEILGVCELFDDPVCQGTSVGVLSEAKPLAPESRGWVPYEWRVAPPPGARSALCFFALQGSPGFEAHLDRLAMRSSETVLFADGFESGDLTGWSTVQGRVQQ